MQHFDLRKFSISSIAVLISFYTNAEQNTLDSQQLDIIQVEAKPSVNAAPAHYLNTQQRINPTQLKNNHSTTLGSVVDKTSGVQSSAFGPNSSRPIVRGLSSQRVAILENNMPINDLAVISGNLATSINPLNAEDIEISKGGATILYGGRSIGGAINVLDEAIPKQILQNKISGQLNLNKGFNAADQGSFKLNVNDGSHWAGHIDASISKISSIKVPHNSKAAVCYDKSYLQSRTDLQRQCQVVIPVLNDVINPAYFKYIRQYYLDNYQDKSLGLSEGDKYTNDRGFMGVNPPNPLYVPNSDYYMKEFGELKEYRTYPKGKIPNSHSETKTFTLGTSYVGDFGYTGLSWHYFNTDYGVPGFAYRASKTNNGYAPVTVKNQTHRLSWDTHWISPLKGIDSLDFQVNYQHSKDQELLGNTVSNGFLSNNYAYRLSLSHTPLFEHFVGTIGTDFSYQTVKVKGQDSYLPDLNRKAYSLFAIETLDLAPFMLEFGHRIGKVSYKLGDLHNSRSQNIGAYYAKDRTFALQNTHFALQFNPTENSYLKLQRTWAERALEMNELYANNNHYALLIEEQGDARLQKEKNKAWELSAGIEQGGVNASVSWYRNQFNHFTYLGYTSIVRNGLMPKEWRQTPLTLTGWEVDLSYKLDTQQWGTWNWHVFYDHIQQKLPHRLTGLGNYLPNLPSSRFGGDLNVEYQNWRAFFSAIHYKAQKHVSNEVDEKLINPSFTLVDVGVSYVYPWKQNEVEIYFNINNLTNREARSNTSPLKFLAPQAGRNAVLGLKVNF
ncbi:TonB-dependent receptor [Avibacterium paragallinarum]|uniref:TonB-dependent receptor n=1 Tax=Avibacterium paragallinarum TaxID=728 RepID=UPI00397DAD62